MGCTVTACMIELCSMNHAVIGLIYDTSVKHVPHDQYLCICTFFNMARVNAL